MKQPMIILQAATPEAVWPQFIMIALIGVIFYLLIFMPMRKRQKKLEAMVAVLKNGDRVITNSGIYGVVAGVKDRTILLKIADQVKIEIAKNAIAGLQDSEEPQQ
jgi:preprotein translocase subunit YajC